MTKLSKLVRVRLGAAKTLTKGATGLFVENGIQPSDKPAT